MIRFTALLLTILTGFCGLVYEVTWQKYLATLLGSNAEATAAVLAIFLGGLSAGYAIFGRLTRLIAARAQTHQRPPRLLLIYAYIEGAIGVWAFLFPSLFGASQSLSLLAPLDHSGLSFAFDVILSTLLIGPPAVLMGGTIPFLTLALAGDIERSTRIHAWIYGFNTVGAFAGAIASAFLLIPRLGLDGVLFAMGVINILAAVIFALLDRVGDRVAPKIAAPSASPPLKRHSAYATVALLAGFAMMALQTTFNRVASLAFGSSHFTFAMIVAVFVLSIAIGSLAVSALPRIPRSVIVGSQWVLALLLALLYFQIPDAPYWAHVVRALFQSVDAAFYPFHTAAFGGIFLVLAVPVGLSGALLPLLFHQLRREVADLGSVAGRLYSWNTIGSLLGALIGGYALLFWLDLHHVYRIALAALIVEAAILTALLFRISWVLSALLIALPLLGAIWIAPAWNPVRLTSGAFRIHEPNAASFKGPDIFFGDRSESDLIFFKDGPTSTITVLKTSQEGERPFMSIVNNGKSDGHLVYDYTTFAMSSLVPALFAKSPQRCFVIGYGTGVSAGELAALEQVREVEVAEISGGVIEAAPLFDIGNLNASKNPKVTTKRGDAYRTLLRSKKKYDVIIAEPSNPWVTGVEMLFSVEFLEAARSHLTPGGVYGQWFHLYELDSETAELVLRTYNSVFPHVSLWYMLGRDILLLGINQPDRALDVQEIEKRFHQPDFSAGFARAGIHSFPALLAHELLPLDTLDATKTGGPLHTINHPILSDMAARAFFRGRLGKLPDITHRTNSRAGIQNSLLRHYLGSDLEKFPEPVLEAAAKETCARDRAAECATLMAAWGRAYPQSERLHSALKHFREGEYAIGSALDENKLSLLRILFGSKGIKDLNSEESLDRAHLLSEKFIHHFHYATPFKRSVLAAAWKRCEAEECSEALAKLEEKIGKLRGSEKTDTRRPARKAR